MANFENRGIRRRTLLKGAAALCVAAAVAPRIAFAQTPLRVGLISNPVSGLIEIGDTNGWYKDAGTEIETTLFTGAAGPKVIQAMGSGSLDISTVSSTAVLMATANGAVPLKIVSISTDPAPLFMLLSGPEIASVTDLMGKKVATPQGTGLQYFLARALKKHGMNLADIDYVNLPVGQAQAAFLAGQVAAIVPSLIGAFTTQQAKPDTKRLFTLGDFTKGSGPRDPFVDYDVFAVSETALSERADAIKAFLTGYHDKAVPYLTAPDTQDKAIEQIVRYVNSKQKSPIDDSIVRELMLQSGFFDHAEAKKIITDKSFVDGLQDQARFFIESGQLKSSRPMSEIVAADLL